MGSNIINTIRKAEETLGIGYFINGVKVSEELFDKVKDDFAREFGEITTTTTTDSSSTDNTTNNEKVVYAQGMAEMFVDNRLTREEIQDFYAATRFDSKCYRASHHILNTPPFDSYAYKLFGLEFDGGYNQPRTTELSTQDHYKINGVDLPDTFWNSRMYIDNHLRAIFLSGTDEPSAANKPSAADESSAAAEPSATEKLSAVGHDLNLTTNDIATLMDTNNDGAVDRHEFDAIKNSRDLSAQGWDSFIRGLSYFGIDIDAIHEKSMKKNPEKIDASANSKEKAMAENNDDWENFQYSSPVERGDYEIARDAVVANKKNIDHVNRELVSDIRFLSYLAKSLRGIHDEERRHIYERLVSLSSSDTAFLQNLAIQWPDVFIFLPEPLRNSKTFVSEFLTGVQLANEEGELLTDIINSIGPELKSDKDTAMLAVTVNGRALEQLKQFAGYKPVVLRAMTSYGAALQWASTTLKNDRDVVLASANTQDTELGASRTLELANPVFKSDKEVVLAVLKNSQRPEIKAQLNHNPFSYVGDTLKKDREVVLEAVRVKGDNLFFAGVSDHFRNDRQIVFEAVCANPEILTSDSLIKYRTERNFLLEALARNPDVWPFLDSDLQVTKERVAEAVNQGVSLEQVRSDLLNEKELVSSAMEKHSDYVDEYLPIFNDNAELMEQHLRSRPYWNGTKADFALLSKEHKILALQRFGEQIYPEQLNDDVVDINEKGATRYIERDDRELIAAAAKSMGTKIFYLMPEKFMDDKTIIDAALNGPVTSNALALFSEEQRKQTSFVVPFVSRNGLMLKYADDSLKANRDVVMTAIQSNGFALTYASESLRKDPELIRLANQQMGFEYFKGPAKAPVAVPAVISTPVNAEEELESVAISMEPVVEVPLEPEPTPTPKSVPVLTQAQAQTQTQPKPKASKPKSDAISDEDY